MSTWNAKLRDHARVLPRSEGTQLRPKTSKLEAKAHYPTKESVVKGHPLNLTRLLSMLKREEIQLLRTVKEENVKLQN